MTYEIVERLGVGVARVRYTGIGTTGLRNLINDTPLRYDSIRSAVQAQERGPPAIEVPNIAGFGSAYVDLLSGDFISEEEYSRRRERDRRRIDLYRHVGIMRGEYDPQRSSDPPVEWELSVWFFTENPIPEEPGRDMLRVLLDRLLDRAREVLPFLEPDEVKTDVNNSRTFSFPGPLRWDPEGTVEAKGIDYPATFTYEGGEELDGNNYTVTIDWDANQ